MRVRTFRGASRVRLWSLTTAAVSVAAGSGDTAAHHSVGLDNIREQRMELSGGKMDVFSRRSGDL